MDISTVSTPAVSIPASQQQKTAALDVDNNGRVSTSDLARYSDGPVLEAIEPDSPQVSRFDNNSDGIVTNSDLAEAFARNNETLRLSVGASTLPERISKAVAEESENSQALDVINDIQFGERSAGSNVDVEV